MPPITLSLNGDWQFKDYYGEDWRWRDAHKPIHKDTRFWRTGSVPGSVHNDLWRAGEIPNPYFERNSLLLEWIPARTWLYRRTFSIPPTMQGQRVQLRFEGVDYSAEFYLNGKWLGDHAGMYTPAVFDVTALLDYTSDNTLAVVIDPAPHEQPQVSRSDKVRTHKSRMTYWWDFCPRMPHIGIWDNVALVGSGSVRIDDKFVRPSLNADFTQAKLAVELTLDSQAAQSVSVDVTIRLDGQTVAQTRQPHSIQTGGNTLNMALTLDNPRLWWPNGYGEQPLYEAEVIVYCNDEISDSRLSCFGIRKVELVPNATPDGTALPYTFVVNGRRLYINGWNWVPQDVMYGVPGTDKLERLMTLAQNAHVNMLRIWGGGLIEREAFYAQCDRRGIMVWQEFIQSSSGIDNNPPQTPDFIALMEREAEQIIPRRRNHPSLVLWCGGNELTTPDITPLDDTHPLLAALKRVVNRLDPDRLWLATSPTGRVFMNGLDEIERDPLSLHDVHGPWEYQGVTGQYTLCNAGTSLVHSEFGVEGITNLKTLNATIAPENQWPVSLDNPVWFHLGAWWVKLPRWRETFGDLPDVATWVCATQYVQASGMQYALEADRRRWPQNSGTLPWQFNEPYPMAACTSAVDYYAQPKPLYYAVARAYAPLHISARFATAAWEDAQQFEADCYVSSAHAQQLDGVMLHARMVGVDGEIYAESDAPALAQANGSTHLLALAQPLEGVGEVFFLDLVLSDADDVLLASNRYAFTRAANLAPLLEVAPTTLDVAADGDTVTVTNTGSAIAMFVWLEDVHPLNATGYVYFSDNYFCLFPGEMRTLTWAWQDVAADAHRVSVQGWNTPHAEIDLNNNA